MSRKDYEKFAIMFQGMLADSFYDGYEICVIQIAKSVADVFKKDNPKFDHSRFMTACGF